MGYATNNGFDPKAFLVKVGTGKTILKFEKSQHVFKQGDAADAVFYIQKGRVKLTVAQKPGGSVMPPLSPGQGEAAAAALCLCSANEGAGASSDIPIICRDIATQEAI
jgi:cyclic nucleotide-binding protein